MKANSTNSVNSANMGSAITFNNFSSKYRNNFIKYVKHLANSDLNILVEEFESLCESETDHELIEISKYILEIREVATKLAVKFMIETLFNYHLNKTPEKYENLCDDLSYNVYINLHDDPSTPEIYCQWVDTWGGVINKVLDRFLQIIYNGYYYASDNLIRPDLYFEILVSYVMEYCNPYNYYEQQDVLNYCYDLIYYTGNTYRKAIEGDEDSINLLIDSHIKFMNHTDIDTLDEETINSYKRSVMILLHTDKFLQENPDFQSCEVLSNPNLVQRYIETIANKVGDENVCEFIN